MKNSLSLWLATMGGLWLLGGLIGYAAATRLIPRTEISPARSAGE